MWLRKAGENQRQPWVSSLPSNTSDTMSCGWDGLQGENTGPLAPYSTRQTDTTMVSKYMVCYKRDTHRMIPVLWTEEYIWRGEREDQTEESGLIATQATTTSGPELLLGPMSEFMALTQLWSLQITPKAERIELYRFDHTLHWPEHWRKLILPLISWSTQERGSYSSRGQD